MREHWLIDQLIQQGVSHFCIAPGSRSTPLVVAIAEHSKAKIHTHFDERGIGFLALGIAKATQLPAVIITTSGTAVANLFPSVVEAHHSCTPLILLTADRPQELRECGANQTIDQTKIFSSFIRWQTELSSLNRESYVRSIGAQSYFYALQNPMGPIHINCPCHEPLYSPSLSKREEGTKISLHLPRLIAKAYQTTKSKGVIFVGKLPKQEDIHPILKLAQRLKWPLFADILSNARLYPSQELLSYYDWIELKPTPEMILHFGERLTSKKALEWAATTKAEYIHVSPFPFLQDPERIITERIQGEILEFCNTFEAPYDPSWMALWKEQIEIEGLYEPCFTLLKNDKFLAVQKPLDCTKLPTQKPFTEIDAMHQLSRQLPKEYGVFLGNGMPIRDADHFLFPSKGKGFFANRGASGIDGNIATLAGLCETMPMLGFIGDQAALYDLNSLPLLKKTKYPAILIISNNYGGGIFHHLPVVNSPYFETLWAAEHKFHFQKAAEMFQLPYFSFEELPFSSKESIVVELITNRYENAHAKKNIKKWSRDPDCLSSRLFRNSS